MRKSSLELMKETLDIFGKDCDGDRVSNAISRVYRSLDGTTYEEGMAAMSAVAAAGIKERSEEMKITQYDLIYQFNRGLKNLLEVADLPL